MLRQYSSTSGWSSETSVNGMRRVTHDGRRRLANDPPLLLITIVIGVRRYRRAASRRPISNFPRRGQKISLSRTIIPIPPGTRRGARARPRIIYRRTYFVIRRERYIRATVESTPPSCPRGGEACRIESHELLLRRFSCISMTHRFARDLSFNGVPLFLSLRSPFCRSYRRGNIGAANSRPSGVEESRRGSR